MVNKLFCVFRFITTATHLWLINSRFLSRLTYIVWYQSHSIAPCRATTKGSWHNKNWEYSNFLKILMGLLDSAPSTCLETLFRCWIWAILIDFLGLVLSDRSVNQMLHLHHKNYWRSKIDIQINKNHTRVLWCNVLCHIQWLTDFFFVFYTGWWLIVTVIKFEYK